MLSLRSGLIIRAFEPYHSEQINLLPKQLLNDFIIGEWFNNKTVATQPEKGNKPFTGDTKVKKGNTKTPRQASRV
jgi:hypothetical protein